MFWNLWCERVKFLNPDENKSSCSETSVATSTSLSTMQLVNSKLKLNENGKPQLWLQYGAGDVADSNVVTVVRIINGRI